MWNIFKPSSSRGVRRHGGRRQISRLGIESLERRECPAVMFGLEGGVLSITGDSGPNVIGISQPRDGVVQVVGDGARRTFHGVNEVFLDAHAGDDVMSVRIGATVSVKLMVNAGEGNDIVTITDGPMSKDLHRTYDAGLYARVDLGTGRDNLRVALNNHHSVGLDVLSSDGGDRIEAPILLNVCQHPSFPSYPCGLRSSLQLGGGNNDVNVRAEGFGNVDLDVVALGGGNSVSVTQNVFTVTFAGNLEPTPDSRANLKLTGDGNKVGFNTRGYDDVDLDLDLTGNSNTVAIVMLLPAVQKIRESAAKMSLSLGEGPNLVSARADGFDNVELFVTAASLISRSAAPVALLDARIKNTGGNENEAGTSEKTEPRYILFEFSNVHGDDSIWIDILYPARTSLDASVNLGDGNDRLKIDSRGISDISLDLNCGPGDDIVNMSATGRITGIAVDPGVFNHRVDLGTGNDSLLIDCTGYSQVTSVIDAGVGNDSIRYRMFSIVDRTQLDVDRARLSFFAKLGEGSDSLVLETSGYREVRTVIDTGPVGDGRDTISAIHQSLRRSSPVKRTRLALDSGMDVYEHRAVGYTVQVTTSSIVTLEYLILALVR